MNVSRMPVPKSSITPGFSSPDSSRGEHASRERDDESAIYLLYNGVTNHWHPVYVVVTRQGQLAPLAHHRCGFAARPDALAEARRLGSAMLLTGCTSRCVMFLAHDIEWDGRQTLDSLDYPRP